MLGEEGRGHVESAVETKTLDIDLKKHVKACYLESCLVEVFRISQVCMEIG